MSARFTFTDETGDIPECTFAGRVHLLHEWPNGGASCLYCWRLIRGDHPQPRHGETVLSMLASEWGKPKPDAV